MARLPIIVAPDPRLKRKCAAVEAVDETVRTLMDDMLETMYAAPGVGLAAPQVGIASRVIVVDIAREGEERSPYRMANPEVIRLSEELASYEEGCLSLPEHYSEVTRPSEATIRYLDENNERREVEVEGMLATCIQHEIDHLDGILFVDRISRLKRDMIIKKLVKAKRAEARTGA